MKRVEDITLVRDFQLFHNVTHFLFRRRRHSLGDFSCFIVVIAALIHSRTPPNAMHSSSSSDCILMAHESPFFNPRLSRPERNFFITIKKNVREDMPGGRRREMEMIGREWFEQERKNHDDDDD